MKEHYEEGNHQGTFDKNYFEKVASYSDRGGYEKMKQSVVSSYQAGFKLLAKLAPEVLEGDHKVALEVGCAFGYGIKSLANYGFEVYGCDISDYAIAKAMEENKNVNFRVVNAQDPHSLLAFGKKFSFILCMDVIEHLSNPEQALRNMCETLSFDGTVFLSTPNPKSRSPYRRYARDPTHISEKPPKEWADLLRSVGFKKTIIRTEHIVPFIHRITGKESYFRAPSILGYRTYVICKK